MSVEDAFTDWFRGCAPYVNAHRGRTFVVQLAGEAIVSDGFAALIHDLALLHILGSKVVLVHGARPQIEHSLQRRGLRGPLSEDGPRITDANSLEAIKEVVGTVRVQIEALLSMGLANSPLAGARIRVSSGNFVTARPLGVRKGVDFLHSGEVRRVDGEAIEHQLHNDAMVLISPIGYSPTGEVFNLMATDLATRVAIELRAAKLIFLTGGSSLTECDGSVTRQLTLEQARRRLEEADHHDPTATRLLGNAVHACRGGVPRVHLIDYRRDGALLRELYTRDGVGTMINADPYDSIRRATVEDVGNILQLIEPLERQGLLVRRSRDKLEADIGAFTVVERDGTTIGCAAVYNYGASQICELACFAIAESYQVSGIGAALLQSAEQQAKRSGCQSLFVLTTQAVQWFKERGFVDANKDQLPAERRAAYDQSRNSRVLVKKL